MAESRTDMSEDKSNLKRAALRSLILYSIEMGFALIGYAYGFGLTVHSWAALLGSMIAIRWLFHVLQMAWMRQSIVEYDRKELRDLFAAEAMQELITIAQNIETVPHGEIAEAAYLYADAMLKAREA
jgi:hypothetical protein